MGNIVNGDDGYIIAGVNFGPASAVESLKTSSAAMDMANYKMDRHHGSIVGPVRGR